jgi:ABC-2 type transport system ATP-binding protein
MHALCTSDDSAALELASARSGVSVVPGAEGGLEVSADTDALDAYVIALGRAGIAVRMLEHRERSLESLFLELTGHAAHVDALAPASYDTPERPRASASVS